MVIRSVVSCATTQFDWEVLGIPYATEGLRKRQAIALNLHGMDLHGIDPLLSMGGTILGSINKGNTLEQANAIMAGYHELGLEALIAIGGDGSLAILRDLAQRGDWNLVAIPKTIDNDVALTEWSVGFDTAVNTVLDALNRLTYTAASHDRVMVLEVMGRTAGHLALHAGIAGGADVILIPEIAYSVGPICDRIQNLRDHWGRRFALVVVAEGAKTLQGEAQRYTDPLGEVRLRGIGQHIMDQITACSREPLDIRLTTLGHVQRGGTPSAMDRVLATAFGKLAVDLVAQGHYDRMTAWRNGEAVSLPIAEVLAQSPTAVDPQGCLVQTAKALGIYLGEDRVRNQPDQVAGAQSKVLMVSPGGDRSC
jgi:6-phosphofructokinase 1